MRLAVGILGLAAWCGNTAAMPVPYDLPKFRPVLDDSKLQAPTSSTNIPHGQFAGESNQYFYLDPTGQYMTFNISGDGNRSELRQETPEWLTSTTMRRSLDARLKVEIPEDNAENVAHNQFTYMQIHDLTNAPNALNKPLIRLTWRRSRSGQTDHLWAAIRIPENPNEPIALDNLDTDWIDMGPRPTGFFDASITVRDNKMRVYIDGQVKIDYDVAYWDGLQNYFKAGVYLQDPGQSEVMFEELSYGLTDPADLDGDGDIDDADFGVAFAAFTGPNSGPSGNPEADLDNDGDVDDADFGIAFAAFTGPGGTASVPEPTSLMLFGLAGLALNRRRRA